MLAQQFKHIEAVALRHLNVEKNQVRMRSVDRGQRFGARRALGDDFNFWIKSQEHGKVAASQRFVVHDDGLNPGWVFVRAHASLLRRIILKRHG
jgi:hypothetical protein